MATIDRRRKAARSKLRTTVTYLSIAVLILTITPQFAKAQPPSAYSVPIIEGLKPSSAVVLVGQPVTFWGKVTNGQPNSTLPHDEQFGVNSSGYHLFWFPGTINSSGGVSWFGQNYADPTSNGTGCSSVGKGVYCAGRSTVSFTTTYLEPGTYNVSVTVYDANFNYSIETTNVTVVNSPISVDINAPCASAASWSSSICYENKTATLTEGYPVWFKADYYTLFGGSQKVLLPNVRYEWNFGDGTTTTTDGQLVGGNATHHVYDQAGVYIASVTAVNATTGQSAEAFLKLRIADAPQAPCVHLPNAVVDAPINFPAEGSTYSPNNATESTLLTLSSGFTGQTVGMQNASFAYPNRGTSTLTSTTYDEAGRSFTCNLETNITNPTTQFDARYGVVSQVGQVTFLNATNVTTMPGGAALANYTWESTCVECEPNIYSYGQAGRYLTFDEGSNTSVTLGTNLTSYNLDSPTYVHSKDVAPTASINSLYDMENISVKFTWGSPSEVANVTVDRETIGNSSTGATSTASTTYSESAASGPLTITLPPQYFELAANNTLNITCRVNQGTFVYDNVTVSIQSATHGATTFNTYQNSLRCADWGNHAAGGWNDPVDSASSNAWQGGPPLFANFTAFSPANTILRATLNLGGNNESFKTAANPSSGGPTLAGWSGIYLPPFGTNAAEETLDLVVTDGNLTGYDNIQVCDYVYGTQCPGPSANDTAPVVQITKTSPTKDYIGDPITDQARVTNVVGPSFGQDVGHSGTTVNDDWVFGDNLSTGYQAGETLASHTYAYSYWQYLVVVYARSPGGSVSANYTFVDVHDQKARPNVQVQSFSTYYKDELIEFYGGNTTHGGFGTQQLAFAWKMGDGWRPGGYIGNLYHAYTSSGSETVNVTVQDPEGMVNWTQVSLTISSSSPTGSTPSSVTTVADRLINYTTGAPWAWDRSPYFNQTWYWHDTNTTSVSWGNLPGHAFVVPGNQSVTIATSISAFGTGSKSFMSTVMDAPISIYLSGLSEVSYGENHTTVVNASVIGGLADMFQPSSGWPYAYNFTYSWNDSTANSRSDRSYPSTQVSHEFTIGRSAQMTVGLTGPWRKFFDTWANTSDLIESVPNFDGDGLPSAYEATVLKISPYQPDYAAHSFLSSGNGETNFLQDYLYNLNLEADQTGDGLTALQELTGSVTGFVTDPLDGNPSGDGIPTGSYSFTSTYPLNNQVAFGASAPTEAPIWNVSYQGPAAAFNSSTLSVELSMTTGISTVSLQLDSPTGVNICLTCASSDYTYTRDANFTSFSFSLLNATPFGGDHSLFVSSGGVLLSPLDFRNSSSPWELWVIPESGSNGGTLVSAEMSLTYYGNPNLADPLKQGLLPGSNVTVPLLDCGESRTSSYSLYNPVTYQITSVDYWPYTEAYYKLSEVQGVPYVIGYSQAAYNSASTACAGDSVSSSLYGVTAEYLGDANFGISPWNYSASNDMQSPGRPLSNGMKALGAFYYNLTQGHYLAYSSDSPVGSVDGPYPADDMKYHGALNPTASSTDGSGTPDTELVDSSNPMSPLALAVNLTSAIDPTCYLLAGSSTYQPTDTISATASTYAGSPSLFSSYATGTTGAQSGQCGDDTGYDNFYLSFNDQYILQLNNSDPTYSVALNLWHQNDWSGSSKASATLSNSTTTGPAGVSHTWGTFGTQAWVTPLVRYPVIIVNSSQELSDLPGYGYRNDGEQQFYAFYLNVYGGASGPFSSGLNVILESRESFFESNFSSVGVNDTSVTSLPSPLNCLSNSTFTNRSTGAAMVQVAGSFYDNVTASCGENLLGYLLPHNSTGNISGSYEVLNNTEVDLLGLSPQILELVPFAGPSGYDSPTGNVPTSFYAKLDWVAVSTYNLVSSLVADASNPGAVATEIWSEVVAFGQAVYHAFAKEWQKYVQPAFQWLADEVGRLASELLHTLLQLLEQAISVITAPISALLTMLVDPYWSIANTSLTDTNNGIYPFGSDPWNAVDSEFDFLSDFSTWVSNALNDMPKWFLQDLSIPERLGGFVISMIEARVSVLSSAGPAPTSIAHMMDDQSSGMQFGSGTLMVSLASVFSNDTGNLTGRPLPTKPIWCGGCFSWAAYWVSLGGLLVGFLAAIAGGPGAVASSGTGGMVLAATSILVGMLSLIVSGVYSDATIPDSEQCQTSQWDGLTHSWITGHNTANQSYFNLLNTTGFDAYVLGVTGLVLGFVGLLMSPVGGPAVLALDLLGIALSVLGLALSFGDEWQVHQACAAGALI